MIYSPFDVIVLLGQPGNEALDNAEESIKKANEVLEGLTNV